jgi:site-specific recombinase XerC
MCTVRARRTGRPVIAWPVIREDYFRWCSDVEGHAAVTTSCRRYTIARLEAHVLPGSPLTATREDVEAWAAATRPRLARSSWRVYLAQARHLFAWLVEHEHRADNPVARLKPPKVARRRPRPASDDVLGEILAGVDDVHVRAAIALARLAGLRRVEIAALTWRDVDLRTGLLYVAHGKGDHTREIPIGPELGRILAALPRDGQVVIPRGNGQSGPSTPNALGARVSAHLKPHGLTMHMLRHSFATSTYAASRDLLLVRDLLGHATAATTEIYARSVGDRAREAVAAAEMRPAVGGRYLRAV